MRDQVEELHAPWAHPPGWVRRSAEAAEVAESAESAGSSQTE